MFGPPIDLTALPHYAAPSRQEPERVAFLGRCSTKDQQDPRSSIAGQHAEASALLEPGQDFTGCYWDVESGMLALPERGRIPDAEYAKLDIAVPRDGGLADLLDAVEAGQIDRVVCERISRVARDLHTSLTVEAHLKRRCVPLDAANEPPGGMTTGRLAMRRSGQVHAELGRAEMMEQSMRGQRQHAASGWQHGPPCYGYAAEIDPDAPATPNRFGGGRPKRRLVLHPDGRRADTVRLMFRMRLAHATITEITEALAADLDRHPLGERQTQWRANRVRRLLAQPKYTGYQVFNRTASRTGAGRANPVTDWVWSARPAHPAIVSMKHWYEAQLVTDQSLRMRATGWERVHAAAAGHGLTLAVVRESDSHVLYEAGRQQIVVPRGPLPDPVADEFIAALLDTR